MTAAIALALTGVVATPAAGQQPLERPQPLQELIRTEVVYPQEKGELQVSVASLFNDGEDAFSLPLDLEYGLTDAWQVGVEWVSVERRGPTADSTFETGGVAVATKYSFMNIRGSNSHAAVGVETTFAAAADSPGRHGRQVEIEPFAAFAADLNRRGLQAFGHLALSASPVGDDDQAGPELQWNAGALMPLGSITLAAELNVRHESVAFGDGEVFVTPSFTMRPRRSWEIGIGVPIGITAASERVALAVLLTYER